MLNLKPYRRQIKSFCGPASLKIVLDYYGVSVTEKEIAEVAGATIEAGVSPEGLVKAAKHFGFNAFLKEGSTLYDLRYYLDKKIPVIVDWFWENDGHYGVVADIDEENITLRDSSFWKIRKMSLEIFLGVWFDYPGNYPKTKDDFIVRVMLIITPKK